MTRERTFQNEFTTSHNSKYNIVKDETTNNSPEDFNERETGFKIPSDINGGSDFKKTFVSNLNSNANHKRMYSNQSAMTSNAERH
jgi:hypothetical protein